MRCQKIRVKIEAYLSSELPSRVRAGVEEHLASCAGCRQAIAAARRLMALGRALPTPPVPDGFANRTLALARQRIPRPAVSPAGWSLAAWWRTASAPMHAAAAAVLVLGLAGGVLMGWSTSRASAASPAKAASQANPLAPYNVDYLTDAPDGSLAQSYLALVSSPAQEGK